jgi:predicted Zn-dependent peptidase
MSEPKLARPVFSTEDFRLVRRAVAAFIRDHQDDPDATKLAHLYHRLGRPG